MYTLNFYIVFFFMGCRNSGWNIKRRIRMINCQENIWTENLTSILNHVFRNNNSGCISLRRIDICIKRPYKGILNLFCLYTWDICLCSSLFSLFLCRYFSEDMELIHFLPLVSFYLSVNTFSFLMFSEGIERDQWHELS